MQYHNERTLVHPPAQNFPHNLYHVQNKAKHKLYQKQHAKQKPHQKKKKKKKLRNQPAPLEKVRDMTQKAEEVEGIANNFSHSPRHQEVDDELVCLHLQYCMHDAEERER